MKSKLTRKIFNRYFWAKIYAKLFGYKYEETPNKYDLLSIREGTIGIGVAYSPQNSNSLNSIYTLMDEIKKTNIWCEQVCEDQGNVFRVNVKKNDKYILNQCHKKVYGVDIFTFTDEEKRLIKNQERKKKLQKLNGNS